MRVPSNPPYRFRRPTRVAEPPVHLKVAHGAQTRAPHAREQGRPLGGAGREASAQGTAKVAVRGGEGAVAAVAVVLLDAAAAVRADDGPGQDRQDFSQRRDGLAGAETEQSAQLLSHVWAAQLRCVAAHRAAASVEGAVGAAAPDVIAGDVVHQLSPQPVSRGPLPVDIDDGEAVAPGGAVPECPVQNLGDVTCADVVEGVAQNALVGAQQRLGIPRVKRGAQGRGPGSRVGQAGEVLDDPLPGRDLNERVLGGQRGSGGTAVSLCDSGLAGACVAGEHHDSGRALDGPFGDKPAELGLDVVAEGFGKVGEVLPVGAGLVRAEDREQPERRHCGQFFRWGSRDVVHWPTALFLGEEGPDGVGTLTKGR